MSKKIGDQLDYLVMEVLMDNGFSVHANCIIDKIKCNEKAWNEVNGGKDFESRIKYILKRFNDNGIVEKGEESASTWKRGKEKFEEKFVELIQEMVKIYEFKFVVDEEGNLKTDMYIFNEYLEDKNQENSKILLTDDIDKLGKYLLHYNLQEKFTINKDEYDDSYITKLE
ncbi:hypothetical protein HYI08_06270 [Clostridium botulinum]|uniref:hypothetical protein n=1 Tax=Clostridium botulinum TaxID=1491 RepID=UPI0013CBA90A|nr:hypothetical protein [Clostridium botulinum]MBY7024815.1 hypothetical protein [Clostridium botulinum]NFN19708.1 hypothetical protein [Clostridium botulinum]NFN48379.1 hypothetical protein [Clostridium botulinum]